MVFEATKEQQAILDAELAPLKVIACAGSGKTATAVRRLLEVRRHMGASKSYAVLLSYSNVAVETFRKEYAEVAAQHKGISNRVLICTVDSFINNNILLPHGAKTMNCAGRPFLVHGYEKFLSNTEYNTYNGSRPIEIQKLDFRFADNGQIEFVDDYDKVLPLEKALESVGNLASTGAFTHALGRFWAIRTLDSVTRLPNILGSRYRHILVDEAQDIGETHAKILSKLQSAGTVLGLVGDPNQAIYEFANSDGSYLRNFAVAESQEFSITINRRSVSPIIDVANKLAGTTSSPKREAPSRKNGAFYVKYAKDSHAELITTFEQILSLHDYDRTKAAILARSISLAAELRGEQEKLGVGATRCFAEAAISRDVRSDITFAFERALEGFLRLLEVTDKGLHERIVSGKRDKVACSIRVLLWKFLKNSTSGIPDTNLPGDDWLTALKRNLKITLPALHAATDIGIRPTWASNVTARDFTDAPLCHQSLFAATGGDIKISTVHKVKGESIPAVMFVTTTKVLNALLAGVGKEEGRIGYVAVTRAADLLILAVEDSTKPQKIKALEAAGFLKWS